MLVRYKQLLGLFLRDDLYSKKFIFDFIASSSNSLNQIHFEKVEKNT